METMNRKTSYGLAILSGVLLLLSFPPFKFGAFLAWIALVPLLIAVYYQPQAKSMGRLADIAALGFLPVLIWLAPWARDLLSRELTSISALAWPGFILGGIFALVGAMAIVETFSEHWQPKHLPAKSSPYVLGRHSGLQMFVLPIAWTAIEFLFINLPGVMRITGAFGFFSMAKTQWLNPPILQLASFTGMYGLTFLILLVNCAIAYAVVHYQESKRPSMQTVAVLVVLVLVFTFGLFRVPAETRGNVNVAIIQASATGEDISDTYLGLSEKSLKYNPQIVMWPISVYGEFSAEQHAGFSSEYNVYLTDGDALVYPNGRVEHHKFGYHMITLFEQIGSADIYPIFSPEIHGFDTELGKVGINVCMELAATLPANNLAKQGVEFIIGPTGSPNDYVFTWVLGSSAILRAAEHRIYAASILGTETGSLIADPYGRIIEDIAPEQGIVAGQIAFIEERTFYTKYGDIFGWLVVGLAVILWGYNFYLKRKSPFTYCSRCRAEIPKGTKGCTQCGKGTKK